MPQRVVEAFENNCAVSGCHNKTSAAGNLSLAPGDVADIIGKSTPNSTYPLVEIGDIYGSYLALKMLNDPEIVGEQMPLGGSDATYELGLILAWIGGLDIPDKIIPPPPPPMSTFSGDVLPLLEDRCSGATCHDPGGGGTGVWTLDGEATYDAIVDVDYATRKLIAPGDLRQSHIWLVLTDTGGIPMPLNRPPLEGFELQIIRDWILDDAPP